MIDDIFSSKKSDKDSENSLCEIRKKLQDAFEIYNLSETFLRDIENDSPKDYGKFKIARLRFEFAKQNLLAVIDEARNMGVKCDKEQLLKNFNNRQIW